MVVRVWALLLLCPTLCWAGAWPLPSGHGQIIQTNLIVKADKGFDQRGTLNLPVQFSKFETSVFLEHGLTDTTTLVLATSFQDLQFTAGVDQVNFKGFGETEIGLRHVLWHKGPSVIAGQATVILVGQGETVSDADLGVGGTQYEARLLAGRSFKLTGRDAFVDLQVAHRFRQSAFPEEWRFDVSAGVRPLPKWQILAQSFYVYGARGAKPSPVKLPGESANFARL